jgi:hypothetical protein
VASIHFDHTRANQADKNACLVLLLANDVAIRNLDTTGSIGEMQEQVNEALVLECTLKEIEADIADGTISQREALCLTINAIRPCVLHLENCVGLKTFTRLLRIGLDNMKEGAMLGNDDGENASIKVHSEQMQEEICNTSVWGSEEHPVRWTCPCDTAKKKITMICLDNVRTRKVINAPDASVDVGIPEGEGREPWKHQQSCVEKRSSCF